MAEKKNTPAGPPATASNGGAARPQAGLTKMEGVKRAQAALGRDAKPLAIQKYVKDRLGIDISTSVISTYKKDIARKAAKGKAKPRVTAKGKPGPAAAAAPRETAPQPPAAAKPAAGGKSGGIPLGDILTVKELVERLGAAPLHTLIDAFAK
jgi:hypothetical protein